MTHSKESALTPREFELLLEGVSQISKDRQRTEARFAVMLMGRLGLRAGEVVHLREEWIDYRTRRIEIPRQMDCHLGKGDGPCGYCQMGSRQMVETYEEKGTEEMPRVRERFLNRHIDGGFNRGDDLTLDDVTQLRWFAKTDAAARSVPFGHNARAELAIERFFELPERDGWNMSKSALNRRLNKALRNADELDERDTMPHGLRATAATHLANQNIDPLSLKNVMGWSDFQVAKNYLSESPDRAERALHNLGSV